MAVELRIAICPSGLTPLLQHLPGKLERDKCQVQGTAWTQCVVAVLGAWNCAGGIGWLHQGTFSCGGLTQRSSPELLAEDDQVALTGTGELLTQRTRS